MSGEPKRYLKASEAAKYLGVSESTMVRLRLAGEGPYFIRFPGGAIRYSPDDLDAYAESIKVRTRAERQDQLSSPTAPAGADRG